MEVSLKQVPMSDLHPFALLSDGGGSKANDDLEELVPRHVAIRSLDLYAMGVEARWCAPFIIYTDSHPDPVGACGFKGAPEDGEVEIGYGVLPLMQGKGIATLAVHALLIMAFNEDTCSSVLATINPINVASRRVAEKLGFVEQESFDDEDGETLVRWRCQASPHPTELLNLAAGAR